MPNLLDFEYYKTKATAAGGQLSVGASLIVSGVQTNAAKPGLYLLGTPAAPIRIQGPVVIPGDVVIRGTITGTNSMATWFNNLDHKSLTRKRSIL